MGSRRIHPTEQSAPLILEPLEDRLLLSGTTTAPVVLLSPHYAVSEAQEGRASSPISFVTPAHQAAPVASAANPAGEKRGDVLLGGFPQVTVYHDGRGFDGDDDSATGRDEPHFSWPQQSFVSFVCPEAINTGTHSCVVIEPEKMPIPAGYLHAVLDQLSVAGLGAAGGVGGATVLPVPTVPSPAGQGQAPPEASEGTPEALGPQTLEAPPPAAGPDGPSPAYSPGDPFTDFLPVDLEAIQRGADAFFEQLADLAAEWDDAGVIEKLTPWLMAATVVTYEWFRLRRMRTTAVDDGCAGPAGFLAGGEG
jgi:hypothetical protein